jgi:hypothetical protein
MRHTQAPLVAHVDDDGTVYPDWLERFMSHFATLPDNLAAVCGGIEPVWGAPPPEWLTDKMKCFLSADSGLGNVPRFLGPEEFICEGNSCFRRAVLEQVGHFPEDLGRAGNNLLSGENVVVNLIRERGYSFYYDPAATLRHFIHANRLTPEWFRQRFFWQGVSGFRQYQMRQSGPLTETAYMQLPLDEKDWDFAQAGQAENIGDSLFKFQCLGFTLALGGLIAAGD